MMTENDNLYVKITFKTKLTERNNPEKKLQKKRNKTLDSGERAKGTKLYTQGGGHKEQNSGLRGEGNRKQISRVRGEGKGTKLKTHGRGK